MKNNLEIFALFCVLLSGAWPSVSAQPQPQPAEAHTDEVKLTEAAIKQHNIQIGTARLQVLTPKLIAPARVSFNTDAMAHVGSIVKGRVVEAKVRVGDMVNKGDELLAIESSELGLAQSEYLQKQGAVAIAESAVEPARTSYERAKSLYEKSQGIALAEVQKREAEYRAATGAFQAAKSAASAAENTLHLLGMSQQQVTALASSGEINPRFVLRAPLAGKVIQREVTLGELVSPEKEALLILADVSSYWVLADVPEARLGEIQLGNKASIELVAMKDPLEGTVTMIGPVVDPETRSAQIRIETKTEHQALRPGMFARVAIALAPPDAMPVLAIPEVAVQTVEGATAVFVCVEDEPNTFAKREVRIGPPVGGMAPVLSGLKAGERLVIDGSFILKAELGKSEAGHEH